jgi:ornithine decarboxylase
MLPQPNPSRNARDSNAPHFLLRPDAVRSAYGDFRRAFPNAGIFYALKANPDPVILGVLAGLDSGFEAASWPEIDLVLSLGVKADRIIYGTAVKPRQHVEQAAHRGVNLFAADSLEELAMLAEAAPGSHVFIRVKADCAQSVFSMGGKFGVPASHAAGLLLHARSLGLVPWGLSFNVGSQARTLEAWAHGVSALKPIFHELLAESVRLSVVNVGGGFPAAYAGEAEIPLEAIAEATVSELAALPYPVDLYVEPGRRLVAESMSLIAHVVRRIERPEGPWLFLDCGVYNALFEALSCQGRTRYPVGCLRPTNANKALFVLAGPTGDGLDIIARDIALPTEIAEGDQLRFDGVGAYTTTLASAFNGFPRPATYLAGR